MADFEDVTNFDINVLERNPSIIVNTISSRDDIIDNIYLEFEEEPEEFKPELYGGNGRIFGYTTIAGIPKRLAVILTFGDKNIVDTMFSRESDGWFEFTNLNINYRYRILVRDLSGKYDDEYRYNVSPVL
jgi:hypothetical protein